MVGNVVFPPLRRSNQGGRRPLSRDPGDVCWYPREVATTGKEKDASHMKNESMWRVSESWWYLALQSQFCSNQCHRAVAESNGLPGGSTDDVFSTPDRNRRNWGICMFDHMRAWRFSHNAQSIFYGGQDVTCKGDSIETNRFSLCGAYMCLLRPTSNHQLPRYVPHAKSTFWA